ncbi:MAG: hypothetical protein JSR63_09765 [Proteobacteria bacterium]|nr:hypothetical protein [Pseudomonadota bacterium]
MAHARTPGIGIWLPWVLLAVAVAAGLALLDRDGSQLAAPISKPVATPVAAVRSPAQAALLQPRLHFDSRVGTMNVAGQLGDTDRARLDMALARTFKAEAVEGDIGSDPGIEPAAWLDEVILLLPDFKATSIKFAIDGDAARVDLSRVPERDRAAISKKIRGLFTGIEVRGLVD